jgi:indole-3-glycerol phosphate synthase
VQWTPPGGALGRLVREARSRAALLASREAELRAAALAAPLAPSFRRALRGERVAIIAEVKRRSPSKGTINDGLSAGRQAAAYARGGAAAVSNHTDPAHINGYGDDLLDAREQVTIPLLKKDFHVLPVQLLEARALGASAVLLIARALGPAELPAMATVARELGLEMLVEIRTVDELERALAVDAEVIGVNNRDLESLEIDVGTSERLVPLIPPERVAVAESGVESVLDIERAARAGADAVLVGSTLSAAGDPVAALRALAAVPRVGRGG